MSFFTFILGLTLFGETFRTSGASNVCSMRVPGKQLETIVRREGGYFALDSNGSMVPPAEVRWFSFEVIRPFRINAGELAIQQAHSFLGETSRAHDAELEKGGWFLKEPPEWEVSVDEGKNTIRVSYRGVYERKKAETGGGVVRGGGSPDGTAQPVAETGSAGTGNSPLGGRIGPDFTSQGVPTGALVGTPEVLQGTGE